MKSKTLVLISALLLVPLLVSADELIRNGGFEDSLNYWTWTPGLGGYYESCNVWSYRPPDHQVCLFKYDATGSVNTRLYQTVSIPYLNLRFSFQGKFQAVELNPAATYSAWSGMALEYRDAGGGYLGRTIFISQTPHSLLVSSPTQHLIPVSDTNWNAYAVDLVNELGNLPGITPDQVRAITVAAMDSTDGC